MKDVALVVFLLSIRREKERGEEREGERERVGREVWKESVNCMM